MKLRHHVMKRQICPEKSREQVLSAIRGHLTALGIDVSTFSDEEIEAAILHFQRVAAVSGISAADAAKALGRALALSSGAAPL